MARSPRTATLSLILAALLAWPWSLLDAACADSANPTPDVTSSPAKPRLSKPLRGDAAPSTTAGTIREMDDDTDDSEGVAATAFHFHFHAVPTPDARATVLIKSRSAESPRSESPLQQTHRLRC